MRGSIAYTCLEISIAGLHHGRPRRYPMQGLNNLTKRELLDLMQVFEQRIADLEAGAEPTRGAQLGIDFIYAQALLVLGNSGIAALIYDTGIDAQGRELTIVG